MGLRNSSRFLRDPMAHEGASVRMQDVTVSDGTRETLGKRRGVRWGTLVGVTSASGRPFALQEPKTWQ